MDGSWSSSDSEGRRSPPRRVLDRNETPDQQALRLQYEPEGRRVPGSAIRMSPPRQELFDISDAERSRAAYSATRSPSDFSQQERLRTNFNTTRERSTRSELGRNENSPPRTPPNDTSHEAMSTAAMAPRRVARSRAVLERSGQPPALDFEDNANFDRPVIPWLDESSQQRTPPRLPSNAALSTASAPRVSLMSPTFNRIERQRLAPDFGFENDSSFSTSLDSRFFESLPPHTPPNGPSHETMSNAAAAMAPRVVGGRSRPCDHNELQHVAQVLDYENEANRVIPSIPMRNDSSPQRTPFNFQSSEATASATPIRSASSPQRTPPNNRSIEVMNSVPTAPARATRSRQHDHREIQDSAQVYSFGTDFDEASPRFPNVRSSPRISPIARNNEVTGAAAMAPRSGRSRAFDRSELQQAVRILDFEGDTSDTSEPQSLYFEDTSGSLSSSDPQEVDLLPAPPAQSLAQSFLSAAQSLAADHTSGGNLSVSVTLVKPRSIPRTVPQMQLTDLSGLQLASRMTSNPANQEPPQRLLPSPQAGALSFQALPPPPQAISQISALRAEQLQFRPLAQGVAPQAQQAISQPQAQQARSQPQAQQAISQPQAQQARSQPQAQQARSPLQAQLARSQPAPQFGQGGQQSVPVSVDAQQVRPQNVPPQASQVPPNQTRYYGRRPQRWCSRQLENELPVPLKLEVRPEQPAPGPELIGQVNGSSLDLQQHLLQPHVQIRGPRAPANVVRAPGDPLEVRTFPDDYIPPHRREPMPWESPLRQPASELCVDPQWQDQQREPQDAAAASSIRPIPIASQQQLQEALLAGSQWPRSASQSVIRAQSQRSPDIREVPIQIPMRYMSLASPPRPQNVSQSQAQQSLSRPSLDARRQPPGDNEPQRAADPRQNRPPYRSPGSGAERREW